MNPSTLRRRIVAHRRVRASELRPHPLNPRQHGDAQRHALRQLLEEIGLARSVVAYVAEADRGPAEPPLTLIDGHLRCDELSEHLVDVEVLDVSDAEAKALLLSLDPLAQLAVYDEERLAELRTLVEEDSAAVANLWAALEAADAVTLGSLQELADKPPPSFEEPESQEMYFVLIECSCEAEQVDLLKRLQAEGLTCTAKCS